MKLLVISTILGAVALAIPGVAGSVLPIDSKLTADNLLLAKSNLYPSSQALRANRALL